MKVLLPVSLIALTSEVHDVTVARASLKITIAMSIVAGLTVAALATPLSRFVTNTEANAGTFMMLGATVVAAGVGPVLSASLLGLQKVRELAVLQILERRVREQEMFEASRRVDEIRSKTTRGTYHAAESVREDRDQA